MKKGKWVVLLGILFFSGVSWFFQSDFESVVYGAGETDYYDYEAPTIINSDESSTRKSSRSQAVENQDIFINRLVVKIKDTDSESLPFSLSDYRIWYTKNINGVNKVFIVHEGTTDENGEIQGITLQDIPSDVTTINIRMIMGQKDRGYVQNTSNKTYGVVYSINIPVSREITINTSSTFGSTAEQKLYAFVSAKINYYFYDSQRELRELVTAAKAIDNTNMELMHSDPINIIFEKGYETNKGSFYTGLGHNKSYIPEIIIADQAPTEDKPEIFKTASFKHNILHEWLHYHMGKNAEIQGGSYKGHYGYNSDFRISYKEGICLLFGDMYAYDYHYPYGGYETIVKRVSTARGRSTNSTAYLVLADLVDTETTQSSDENVSIGRKYAEENGMTDYEERRLNLGLMYNIAMGPQPKTMAQFLTAYQQKYISTETEKQNFEELLGVNTLSVQNNNFTLKPDPDYPNDYSLPLTEEEIIYGETGIRQISFLMESEQFEQNDLSIHFRELGVLEE